MTTIANNPDTLKQARQHALLFKALGDPTRLGILALLTRHGGDIHVTEIVEHFDLEQPSISHHLHILYTAGLVDYFKSGLYCFYYVNLDRLREVHGIIDG